MCTGRGRSPARVRVPMGRSYGISRRCPSCSSAIAFPPRPDCLRCTREFAFRGDWRHSRWWAARFRLAGMSSAAARRSTRCPARFPCSQRGRCCDVLRRCCARSASSGERPSAAHLWRVFIDCGSRTNVFDTASITAGSRPLPSSGTLFGERKRCGRRPERATTTAAYQVAVLGRIGQQIGHDLRQPSGSPLIRDTSAEPRDSRTWF